MTWLPRSLQGLVIYQRTKDCNQMLVKSFMSLPLYKRNVDDASRW